MCTHRGFIKQTPQYFQAALVKTLKLNCPIHSKFSAEGGKLKKEKKWMYGEGTSLEEMKSQVVGKREKIDYSSSISSIYLVEILLACELSGSSSSDRCPLGFRYEQYIKTA